MIDNFSKEEINLMLDEEVSIYLQNDIEDIVFKIEVIKQGKKMLHETKVKNQLLYYKEKENDGLHINEVSNVMYMFDIWKDIIEDLRFDLIPKVNTLKLFEEFSEYYNANESWLI